MTTHNCLFYSNDLDGTERYAADILSELQIEAIIAPDYETVVHKSDVLVTTTPVKNPYLRVDWLKPGIHITCKGSDSEDKQEVHSDVFARVDRIICDLKSQCFKLGELHHALEAGVVNLDDQIDELGELTSSFKLGRQRDDEIKICDLTGVGVQDMAIELFTYERASMMGLGVEIEV